MRMASSQHSHTADEVEEEEEEEEEDDNEEDDEEDDEYDYNDGENMDAQSQALTSSGLDIIIGKIPVDHHSYCRENETMLMFLENATGRDQIKIEHYSTTGREAVVHIEDALKSDTEEIMKQIQAKQFLSATLDVKVAPIQNRLLVTHMKTDIKEDLIVLCLEQSKYNPDFSGVHVKCDLRKLAAIITFDDISGFAVEVIPRVLDDHPQQFGPEAVLEVCHALFQLDDVPHPEHPSRNNPELQDEQPVSDQLEAADESSEQAGPLRRGGRGRRRRGRGRRNRYHSVQLHSNERDDVPFNRNDDLKIRSVGSKESVGSVPSLLDLDFDEDGDRQDNRQGDSSQCRGERYQWPRRSRESGQVRRYGSRRGWGADNAPRRGYHDGSGQEYRGYRSCRSGRIRGRRRGMEDGSRRDYGIHCDVCKEISLHSEIKDEKCLLLIIMAADIKQKNGCGVRVDKEKHLVRISGRTQDAVDETFEYASELIVNMHSVSLKISPDVAKKLEKKNWPKDYFRREKIPAVYYMDHSSHKVIATSEEIATSAAKRLESQVVCIKVPYSQSHEEYLSSQPWKECLGSLKDYIIHVDVEPRSSGGGMVVLEGVEEDVKSVTGVIQHTLEGNKVAVETLSMKEAQLCLVQANEKLIRKKPASVIIQYKLKEEKMFISGPPDDAVTVRKSVEALMKTQCSTEFEIMEPGIKKKIFEKEGGSLQLAVDFLMKANSCMIEIMDKQDLENRQPTERVSSGHRNRFQELHSCVDTERREYDAGSGENDGRRIYSKAHSNSSSLDVVDGDITKFTADVLVNAVAGKNNLSQLASCGTISAAFHRAGGSELQQAYFDAGNFRSHPQGKFPKHQRVIITPSYGNLRTSAQKIFHIHTKSCSKTDSAKSEKKMLDRIEACLEKAASLRLKEIAFPTIGCGQLGYPPAVIARCFQQAVQNQRGNVHVTVVVYGSEAFNRFKSLCTGSNGDASQHPQYTGSFSSGQDHHHAPSDRNYRYSASPHASSADRVDVPSKSFCVLVRVHSFKDSINKTVEAELRQKVDEFVTKVTILLHDELSEDVNRSIKALQTRSVWIKIDTKRSQISVSGTKDKVERVHAKICDILKSTTGGIRRTSSPNLDQIRQTKSRSDVLAAFIASDIHAPKHWTKFQGDLTTISRASPPVQVQVPRATFDVIQKMIMDTWQANVVGVGHDANGLTHQNIRVKAIHRIENVKLYKRYEAKKREMCDYQRHANIPQVKGLAGEREIATLESRGYGELNKTLLSEMNECYLFHGTDGQKMEGIINSGFDSRLGNQEALFGKGTYFAESSTKADQYADDPANRTPIGTTLYMFIAKVFLGHTFICKEPKQFKRPPCLSRDCCDDMCTKAHGFYDSVIGTHKFNNPNMAAVKQKFVGLVQSNPSGGPTARLLFREFVVYEPSQCYPEYLVEYQRC